MRRGRRYVLVAVLLDIKHSVRGWPRGHGLLGKARGWGGEKGGVIVDIAGVDGDSYRHGEALLKALAALQAKLSHTEQNSTNGGNASFTFKLILKLRTCNLLF